MSKATSKTNSHGASTTSYVIGFILSLILTLTAFWLVENKMLSGWLLIFCLAELAFVQLFVQLFLFLHLGNESKPRWNLMIFLSTVLVVGILVIGSLWIMSNLNYNMGHDMSPEETTDYILEEEGYNN